MRIQNFHRPLLAVAATVFMVPSWANIGMMAHGAAHSAHAASPVTYNTPYQLQPANGTASLVIDGSGGTASSRSEWGLMEGGAVSGGVGTDHENRESANSGAIGVSGYRDWVTLSSSNPAHANLYATVRAEIIVGGSQRVDTHGNTGQFVGSATSNYAFFASGCGGCGGGISLWENVTSQYGVTTHRTLLNNQEGLIGSIGGSWLVDIRMIVSPFGGVLFSSDQYAAADTASYFGGSFDAWATTTMRWGGVKSITIGDTVYSMDGHLNGRSIGDSLSLSGFTLVGDSGIDWINATPVPEPATYALMALGLVAIGLRAQRRLQTA